jgi:glycosyltransferase involved in cell wall biosynthesis
MDDKKGPLVSVCITAYNREKLLPKAIDSVLKQRVDFPIEIVIGEDCSQDNTASVARAYQQKYPDVVRLFINETNLGCRGNTWQTLDRCGGTFTAWLDSDDYYTDPDKLSIQVAALQQDPTLAACCHYVRWVHPDGTVYKPQYPGMSPGRYAMSEILHNNFISTASAMFRTGIHRRLPSWYMHKSGPESDWPLWLIAAEDGDILLIDRIMADYTLAPESEMTSKGPLYWYQSDIRFYGLVEDSVPKEHRALVRHEKGRRYQAMMWELCRQRRYPEARRAAFLAFTAPGLHVDFWQKSRAALSGFVDELRWRI